MRFCSLAAGLVLLAGCGDDSGQQTAAATTAATTVTAPAAPTTAPVSATTTVVTTTAAAPTTTEPPAPAGPGPVTISVRVGVDDAATTGGRVERVPLGSQVRVELTADRALEYHLHDPYDIEVRGAPGATAVIEFTADRPGEVELERHDTGALLVLLVIS